MGLISSNIVESLPSPPPPLPLSSDQTSNLVWWSDVLLLEGKAEGGGGGGERESERVRDREREREREGER